MPQVFTKDPNAKKNYNIIWYTWLGDDTLASSTITADSGITVESDDINSSEVTIGGVDYPANTVVIIQVSGGEDGVDYEIVNHIVTATSGEEENRTITIKVREQ